MKTEICPTCNGTYITPCSHCNGKGDTRDFVKKAELPESEIAPCRWCRGEKTERCRTCEGMGITHPPEPQRSMDIWKRNAEWAEIIRGVAATQNHRNAPTKRFKTAIEKAINDPNVYVAWSVEHGFYNVRIWYSTARRNDYEEQFHLFWSFGQWDEPVFNKDIQISDHPSWAKLDEELNIIDCRDYIERAEQEKTIAAKLDQINGQIANLDEQIAALREEAKRDLEKLPTPVSATIRIHRVHWDQPTIYAKSTYPHIWPSKK